MPLKRGNVSGRDYFQEIEVMSNGIRQRTEGINSNILVSAQDKKDIDDFVKNLFTEIAHTRQDLEKLED